MSTQPSELEIVTSRAAVEATLIGGDPIVAQRKATRRVSARRRIERAAPAPAPAAQREAAVAAFETWLRSPARVQPPLAVLAHHMQGVRDHEARIVETLARPLTGDSLGELAWHRRFVDGHAARAIAAFLAWGLS